MGRWEDMGVPKDVADAQERWDRNMRILAAVRNGATMKQIARHTGWSYQMVVSWMHNAERLASRPDIYKPPVEHWFEGRSMYASYDDKRNGRMRALKLRPRVMNALDELANPDGRDWLRI